MSVTTLPTAEETRVRLASLFALIATELAESERIFRAELASRFAFVQRMVDHAVALRGKRLRPALLLLSAKACGRIDRAHPILAAVVEMIHAATLVHDDILDESEARRHSATVNAVWGNETAVLLGDYLFTHAFHLASTLETTLACRWIGRATNQTCEGEMMQVNHRGNLDLDEADYLEIIRGKTAELTAVSCRLGAHYAGAPSATVARLEEYGRQLGVAFQIADDVLDLLGDEDVTGKTLGTDLEKQKLTLPVIHLLRTSPRTIADRVRRILGEHPAGARRELRPYLDGSDSIAYAWSRADTAAQAALDCLQEVPPTPARDVLSQLARYVIRRPY
jgi:octaprenyl-diphosphate synthase